MRDVEKLAIQYLMYSPDAVRELVTAGIDVTYFNNEVNKTFMRIIYDYFRDHGKMVAATALAIKLEQLKVQAQTITEYTQPNFEELCDLDIDFLITELQRNKKQAILTTGLQQVVFNMNNGDITEAEAEVHKVMRDLIHTDGHKKLAVNVNSDIDVILDTLDIPKTERLLETGYVEFDQATGGFQPGWLVLLSALPKIGKTQSLINLACGLVRRQVNVLVFTLEVPKDQYIDLVVSCFGNINIKNIRKRTLSAGDKLVLDDLRIRLKEQYGKLTVVDTLGGCNADYLNAQIEEQQLRNGIKYDVVIVDHATMMKANVPTGKDHFDQGSIAEDLRSIARKRSLTLIAAVQRRNIAQKKNRKQSGEEDQKPEDVGGEEIGRSLIWYQTADIVIMIQNEKPDDENAISTLRYRIINRYGPSSTFELIKDFSKTSLMSVEGNAHMKGLWEDNKLG